VGRVDARVGYTLEKLVHSHAPVGLGHDIRRPEVEALGVGHASTAVDDQICVDCFPPALRVQLQAVTAAALLEPGHFRVEPELDAKAPRVVYEARDEVLLEMLERLPSADGGRLRAGPPG